MAYPPNVDAAVFLVKEIMPIVWKKIPTARVLLAGASPANKVQSLQSKLVKVSGWMDDIRDSYSSAMVQFISLNFREAYFVWSDYHQFVVDMINPDIVVVAKVERYL